MIEHADTDAREFVVRMFGHVVGRKPIDAELRYGLARIASLETLREYLSELASSNEAQQNLLVRSEAPLFVPPGHYYSPVVNVHELQRTRAKTRASQQALRATRLNSVIQFELFKKLSAKFGTIKFPVKPDSNFRYYFENDFYSYGDALVLSAFIQTFRPRRIVEVGSGYSSAVILDTLDRTDVAGDRTKCAFVEPNPARLKSLLWPNDRNRVTIIEKPVQEADSALFTNLEANDIVFFDTTHVLKTNSDVHYELFSILPELSSGVIIHFHDVFDGFEYPDAWTINDNRSWNELYALRAFLMYNNAFDILLLNDLIAHRFTVEARAISPNFMKNPGGGLYLRKL